MLQCCRLGSRSDLFRRSLKNAGWSTLDPIVSPLLMVLATPFLVQKLGVEHYGIWILVYSVVGLIGLVNMGLSDATTRYVAQYLAIGRVSSVVHVIRITITIYLLLAVATGAVIYAISPVLVEHVFRISDELRHTATHALRLGGVMLAAKILESVFVAALKGFERYDIASRIILIARIAVISAAVLLAADGFGVSTILLSAIVINAASLFLLIIATKGLAPGSYFSPSYDADLLKKIYSYGIWSWSQGIAGTLFSQADRFLIISILGTSALTYYSASLLVAQQIHAVLAAAAGFVFPLSSRLHGSEDIRRLREVYTKTMAVVTSLATATVIPVYFCASPLLTLWMGPAFAKEGAEVLQLLILAFGGLSLTIVPYYLLNGSGFIRYNVFFGILSSFVLITAGLVLLPRIGIIGAGWAQLFNFLIIATYLIFVEKIIFKVKSWVSAVGYLIPYVVPIFVMLISYHLVVSTETGLKSYVIMVLVFTLLGAILSYYLSAIKGNK